MYPASLAQPILREDKKLMRDLGPMTTCLFLLEARIGVSNETKLKVGLHALFSLQPFPGEQYSSQEYSSLNKPPDTYSSQQQSLGLQYSSQQYSSTGALA